MHELIVVHADIINVTGYVRGNRDDIGADAGIPGPGRIEIVGRHIVTKKAGYNEQDYSQQHTYDGMHLESLLYRMLATSPPPQKRQTNRAKRASGSCQNRR